MGVALVIDGVRDLGIEYGAILAAVKARGERVAPRGQATLEVRPLVLRLLDPRRCIVSRKGFSEALMWAEIVQLVAGVYDQQLYAVVADERTVKLLTEFGAYGPRTVAQLPRALVELQRDPDSRRAVVYVGRATDLEHVAAGDGDMPCTQTWQFLLRGGALELQVNMRSWDLVWGLSYDVPCAAQVQMLAAASLHVGLGQLTFVAGSGHIYERHWDLVPRHPYGNTELTSLYQGDEGDGRSAPSNFTRTSLRADGIIRYWALADDAGALGAFAEAVVSWQRRASSLWSGAARSGV